MKRTCGIGAYTCGMSAGVPPSVVFRTCAKQYRPPRTFLDFRTPLDLLVATILSAQCTDARVNRVTTTVLYPKYRTAADYASVSQEELENDIQSCGFFRAKTKNIRGMAQRLVEHHHGRVPRTMEELVALPGVGRKTAAVILSAAFDRQEGIAVDTHVQRVAQRLGLTTHHDPKRIELDLMEAFPRKNWGRVTTLLISHGRAVCTARNRGCDRCPFADACPSSWTQGKTDHARKTASASKKRRRVH